MNKQRNCNGKKILEKLVSTQEYEYIVSESKENKEQMNKADSSKTETREQDQFSDYTIKFQKKISTKEKLPGILAKKTQMQKQEDFKQIIHKVRLQNVNLEEKVKDMINDKTSLKQIMNKIEFNVKNQKCNQFQQQKDETSNQNKKNQVDSFYIKKKYLQILSEFIGEYIFKKHF